MFVENYEAHKSTLQRREKMAGIAWLFVCKQSFEEKPELLSDI